MDKIIGILPIEGVSRSEKKPFRFYEVSILPSENVDKLIGTRAKVMSCYDDELCNAIAYKLTEALKSGLDCLECTKIISHYSGGRNVLDFALFPD